MSAQLSWLRCETRDGHDNNNNNNNYNKNNNNNNKDNKNDNNINARKQIRWAEEILTEKMLPPLILKFINIYKK